MKKLLLIPLLLIVIAGLVLGGCGGQAPAPAPAPAPDPKPEPITLTAVLFVAKDNLTVSPFMKIVDKINAAANGELVIDIKGGPELIPPREVGEAARSGAIDVGYTPFSYYAKIVPIARGMAVSVRTFEEERENGYYDFLVREHAKGGLRFIGRGEKYSDFRMYSTTPITDPKEGFKGLRWRASGIYTFLEDLGLSPTSVSHDDMYSALERNVVDGANTKQPSYNRAKLYEVAPYWVGPGFWGGGGSGWVMNLDKFNSLPKKFQDLIVNTQRDSEPMIKEMALANEEAALKEFFDNGGKHVEWSDADNEWFFDLINMTFERSIKDIVSPELLDEMLKLEGLR